jgi:hypothetical protein
LSSFFSVNPLPLKFNFIHNFDLMDVKGSYSHVLGNDAVVTPWSSSLSPSRFLRTVTLRDVNTVVFISCACSVTRHLSCQRKRISLILEGG